MFKIIGGDGREYGPVPGAQIRQWISEGRANGQTRAALQGTADFKPLSEFTEFADLFAPKTPAAPTPAAVSAPPIPAIAPPTVIALTLTAVRLTPTDCAASSSSPTERSTAP